MPHSKMLSAALAAAIAAPALAQGAGFVNWESPQSHPIDLTPNGLVLLAVNTADARLEVYDVNGGIPVRRGSVAVGLDPVSVRARTDGEAWVVNQVSDTVSVVDLASMRVKRTLLVGDEPADVVFAGSPEKAFVSLSVPERVAVLDAANPGAVASVAIQGSQPRAMAVSPDRSTVYLAIFESGNHSTALPHATVSLAASPYAGQNPPPNAGNAFSPAKAASNGTAPRVGQIVRKNTATGQWLDGNGRNWSNFVTWDVHDHDVAVIDASSNAVTYVNGLMNIVAGIGTAPNGDVVAVGLESRNDLRFEQNINGVFIKCMAARIAGGAGTVVDMNPHLTYAAPTTDVVSRLQSVGDPRGVAIGANGTAWTAGLGSNNVIAFNPATGARVATVGVGEGPTGLVLSPDGTRLYVLNRFEGSVSAVSTVSNAELVRIAFHDPTPAAVKAGRKFLFDTHLTSGLGQASCASCHVDGRSDRISWDLGNPQGAVQAFDETCQAPNGCVPWHPMKGPLTTQTLMGIIGNEPFHWRGEKNDLTEFNEAFVGLQGRDSQITAAEMASLQDYVASLTFGPNPNRNIDNSLRTSVAINGGVVTGPGGTGNAQAGQTVFNTALIFGAPPGLACVNCHTGPAGTNNRVDIPAPGGAEPQNRKNSPLRDVYRKVGASKGSLANNRGFGFDHGGDEFTLQDLLSIGFRFNTLPGGGTQQRRDVEAFMLSFGTDTHAGVGQQSTAANAGGTGDDAARITQLINIASAQSTQVGLIAKGTRNGQPRGWMLQSGTFVSDRSGETLTPAALLAGAVAGGETTYTLVPAGMARRLGIDRDGDNALDGDELAAGTDPADPSSFPGACPWDIAPFGARDGQVNGADLGLVLSAWGLPGITDLNGDGVTNGADLAQVLANWGPCP